ncbi:hypothetical protein DQ04_06631000, partial [Trypanosoma grayi]|uniref:hypothetical protein n=1 Tax=Trypanosoma grayi TaxID=71804 RepID=UPI0004F44969
MPITGNAGGSRRMLLMSCLCLPSRAPRADSSATAKYGPTRHRTFSHRFRPDLMKPSQRGQCEETSMHLLSCPALKSLRCHFGADGGDMEKLCFMKFSRCLLAVERLRPQQ